MPKLNEAAPLLFDTINNKTRHIDYDRCVEIAKDYTAYATGHGIGEYLKRFNLRETEVAFAQRKLLTQVNTTDIVSRLRKPLAKVNRTPANFSISWTGKDVKTTVERRKALFNVGSKFWGDKSVQKYLTQRLAELDTTDPNSFLVIEFKERVKKENPNVKANPYPFEVNSLEAVNYEYVNNVLQWLIVLNATKMIDGKGNWTDAELYLMYLDKHNLKATEIHPDTVDDFRALYKGAPEITESTKVNLIPGKVYLYSTGKDDLEGTAANKSKRWFVLEVFEHKIGFVPAKRIGTTLDPITRYRTCVPVIHPAKCYLEKSIKAMSEMDLTMCLHTFPQKIQYADACDGQRVGETTINCIKGLTNAGTTCKACNGTGFKGHTSAQDVLQIRMPRDPSEIVSLENILVYKHPPIDLLKFQQEYSFDVLINTAVSAVYNSQIFSQRKIAETATGENIDLDAVYDTLKDFADNSSEFHVFCFSCIASLRGLAEGLVLTHSFPSDFKMQPLASLLDDLEKANKNGAPSHVKAAINKKIVGKMYMDQPDKIIRIDTKDKYFPFQGKTEAEINFILASDLTTRFNKIFYSHFDLVFSDIEYQSALRNLDFYEMDETMQRSLILAKVSEIITEIDKDSSASMDGAFNPEGATGSDLNLPQDVEAEAKAKLKGSVGGVQGILEIQASFATGTTTRDSALAMLNEIFGFSDEVASRILGEPKIIKLPATGTSGFNG